MFQPFRKSTQARTPDLSAATAQQGKLDNQAKQRANALRQQNIGNTMLGAKLYNANVDGTPIADYFRNGDMGGDAAMAEVSAAGPEGAFINGAETTGMGSEALTADGLASGFSGPLETAGMGSEALTAESLASGMVPEIGAAAELGGATASGGAMSALSSAMPYAGAAMALYSLLNR